MLEFFVMMFVLSALAILPSLVLTLLAVRAFRRRRNFWYYNFSFASFCNALLLSLFLLYFLFAPRQLDAGETWMLLGVPELLWLLGLPLLGLIFSFGSFLLGLLMFTAMSFQNEFPAKKQLPSYPFWISVGSLIGFGFAWLLLIVVKTLRFY